MAEITARDKIVAAHREAAEQAERQRESRRAANLTLVNDLADQARMLMLRNLGLETADLVLVSRRITPELDAALGNEKESKAIDELVYNTESPYWGTSMTATVAVIDHVKLTGLDGEFVVRYHVDEDGGSGFADLTTLEWHATFVQGTTVITTLTDISLD